MSVGTAMDITPPLADCIRVALSARMGIYTMWVPALMRNGDRVMAGAGARGAAGLGAGRACFAATTPAAPARMGLAPT